MALVLLALLSGCDSKEGLQPVVTHDDLVELSGYRAVVLKVPYPRHEQRLYFKKETSKGDVEYWSAYDLAAQTSEIKLLLNPDERRMRRVYRPDSNGVVWGGGYHSSGEKSPFAYPDYEQFAFPGGKIDLRDFYLVYSDEWFGRDLALERAIFPEGDERNDARWMLITLVTESELPREWEWLIPTPADSQE